MLEISIEGTNDFSLCRPSGEIDAYTVDQFRDALSSLATVSKLLIDLSDVPFMDSAGPVSYTHLTLPTIYSV